MCVCVFLFICYRYMLYIYKNTYIVICYMLYSWAAVFKHVRLNNKDTFCLYYFIKILSSFLIGQRWYICSNVS